MKKIIRTLCLVAMVALVATSCKKKEENTKVTIAFEETKGFEAGPSFDGSKAYLDPNDGYRFKWNDNDKIALYNLSKSNYKESTCTVLTAESGSEGLPRTGFDVSNVGPKKDGYFAFYHADKAKGATTGKLQREGNVETFTVGATQTYNPTHLIDQEALVMACESPDLNVFSLHHIFGFLNVGIGHNSSNGNVDYIRVEDEHKHLTGDLSLKLDEVNPQELSTLMNLLQAANGDEQDPTYQTALANYLNHSGYYASGELGNTITLNCGGVALTSGKYRYFFIPLRPGALYKGFTVTIHYTNGSEKSHHFEGVQYLIKPGTFTDVYATSAGKWWNGSAWVD